MSYGADYIDYLNEIHNDEWYEHDDGPARNRTCRTCAHNGCCADLPHCGGRYWVSAWHDDEEPEESEEEGEDNDEQEGAEK